MQNYFRITGYWPDKDKSFIMDSNGKFDELWKFSKFVMDKGCKVLEVDKQENFIDLNVGAIKDDSSKTEIMATCEGLPNSFFKIINNTIYRGIELDGKCYIPNIRKYSRKEEIEL